MGKPLILFIFCGQAPNGSLCWQVQKSTEALKNLLILAIFEHFLLGTFVLSAQQEKPGACLFTMAKPVFYLLPSPILF